jgi:hypothetical protein
MLHWLTRHRTREPEDMKPPLDEAEAAVQRAQAANKEAEENLRQIREIAEDLRGEREEDHFAPDIYRAMMRRRRP